MSKELSSEDFEFVKSQLVGAGLSPEQAEAKIASDGYTTKSFGAKALDYGLKTLDYTGGLTRLGAGKAYEAASGQDLKLPDLMDVLTMEKEAPMTEEMIQAAGGMQDYPLSRKAIGFAGDVLLDPATVLTLGGAGLAKAGLSKAAKGAATAAKVADYANPLGKLAGVGLQKAGRPIYNSAFKNIDSRLIEKGAAPISDYMYQGNVRGGAKAAEDYMQSRMAQLSPERQQIYAQIENAGNMVDPYAASQDALKQVMEVEKIPYNAPKVEGMLDYLSLANKPMPVSQASNIKTALYDSLPDSAFGKNGQLTNDGKKLLKELAGGYKTEIEKAAELTSPGLGKKVSSLNEEWGTYLGATTPTKKEIAKEARKNGFTQVDAMAAMVSPKLFAGKQAMKALNTPTVRTNIGMGLDKLADTPAAAALWRQLLLAPTGQGEE